MKMTERQACLLTAKLWNEIYDLVMCPGDLTKPEFTIPHFLKLRALHNIKADVDMENSCPCCEFAAGINGRIDCQKCPMRGMWVFGENGDTDCEKIYSPYRDFIDSADQYDPNTDTCYDPACAREIVYRALEMAEWWADIKDMNQM